MPERAAFFIDAGFLKAEGAKRLGISPARCRIDAVAAVAFLRSLSSDEWGLEFLRAYWYDGRFPPDDPRSPSQQRYLDAIGLTPGLTIRLGTVKQVTPAWLHALRAALARTGIDLDGLGVRMGPVDVQKGVDALLILDLVRLAQKRAFALAALVAGDRDFLEAVRTVQDEGCRVVLMHPVGAGIDPELRRTVDAVQPLDEAELRRFMSATRP
ncbi:MAG: hypothetical protein KatS3mg065_0556 [Chloroflexota bacterium]|nr:MAG: hypothetical protein KatS3mg065_0556 [Chloroflexota bacterium]